MGRRRSRGDVPVRVVIATVFLLSGCDGRDHRQPPPKVLEGTRAHTPLWVDSSGQPNRNADAATTAAVMLEDGTVRFAEDIYRQDTRLDEALAKLAAAQLNEEPH